MYSNVPAPAGRILDYIAQKESRGNYRAYIGSAGNQNPLPATFDDVLAFQDNLVKNLHKPSGAMGRYQIIKKTLQGLMAGLKLPGSSLFTNDMQDFLAFQLLIQRGYNQWFSGTLSNSNFADNLAKEWASMPYHTGASYYAGDSAGNKSLVGRDEFVAAIRDAKNAISSGSPPPVVKDAPKAAQKGTPMFGSLFGMLPSVLGLVVKNLGAVGTVAAHLPGVVKGAVNSVDDVQGAIAAVEELIKDIKSGTYKDIPEDVEAILKALEDIGSNFGLNFGNLGVAVATLPDTPSVASVKAVEKLQA